MTSVKPHSITHNTFVIERSYPVPPKRVFAAFADPAIKRRWYAESGTHDVEEFEMEFHVGGRECTRYRFREGTPFPGAELANEGNFQDIVPDERIVTASSMSLSGRRFSVSLVTIEMTPAANGTTLTCTHQGVFFEGSDGPQIREAGFRKQLDSLAAELAR